MTHAPHSREQNRPETVSPSDVITFFPDVRAELQRLSKEHNTSISSLVNGMIALWIRE